MIGITYRRFNLSPTLGAGQVRRVQYTIVIEKGPTSYGAYVPDLPGCIAAAETIEEVSDLIREAVVSHLEMLAEDGLPIPEPRSSAHLVEV